MTCEAFSCTPTEALSQPVPTVLEVLEARSFRRAYQAVEDADASDDAVPPSGPMVDAVMACHKRAAREARLRREQ